VHGEGPLKQALILLFERARKKKKSALANMRIQFFDRSGFTALHQALAGYRNADVKLNLDAGIVADGIENFHVKFEGSHDKANPVRSFLDPFYRTARDSQCEGTYALAFEKPLSTAAADADSFTDALTKYGGAEAYVEAEAAPEKED